MNTTYQAMRTFADSWGLLFMFLVFVLVVWRALRPSAKGAYNDAANQPSIVALIGAGAETGAAGEKRKPDIGAIGNNSRQ